MSKTKAPELLVIVGPTASGKSDLALKIAREFGGEIICADSRTIYKDMDIGTAKPSLKEQKMVPHWGLDIIRPGEKYSADKFKKYAETKITEVQARKKLPILVGGTGLYIDSVLFDFSFVKTSSARRLVYSKLPASKLQEMIKQKKIPMPENQQNKRHLVAALARGGKIGAKSSMPPENTLIIGLKPDESTLRARIDKRAYKLFQRGIVKETEGLIDKYGKKSLNKSTGIVYGLAIGVIEGKISPDDALERFKQADWQYARRQRTWFKRNKFIQWFESGEQAYRYVAKSLNN